MGKYMRKRSVGRPTPAAVELGVRTRARSAAAAAEAAAEAPAPKRPRKQQAAARAEEAEAAVSRNDGGGGAAAHAGCCYLQLRSRRLFMPASEVHCPVAPPSSAAAVERPGSASVEPVDDVVAAGISRCSSTASSSVDVVVGVLPAVAPARERSGGAEAEEARDDDCECDVESVVSDSAGCRRRERRETTPSSRTPVDLSDEEWSQSADDDPKRHRRTATLATTATTNAVAACTRPTMPQAGEIDAFFVAAEKAQAQRFAAKYNFDVARGLPLGAGRYEWTRVASG